MFVRPLQPAAAAVDSDIQVHGIEIVAGRDVLHANRRAQLVCPGLGCGAGARHSQVSLFCSAVLSGEQYYRGVTGSWFVQRYECCCRGSTLSRSCTALFPTRDGVCWVYGPSTYHTPMLRVRHNIQTRTRTIRGDVRAYGCCSVRFRLRRVIVYILFCPSVDFAYGNKEPRVLSPHHSVFPLLPTASSSTP